MRLGTFIMIISGVIFALTLLYISTEMVETKQPRTPGPLKVHVPSDLQKLEELTAACLEETQNLRQDINHLERVVYVGITKGLIQEIARIEVEADNLPPQPLDVD